MKTLDVQERLTFARAAAAVIRSLEIRNTEMRYEELGRAIGLIADDEKWQAWHQQQVKALLIIVAAVERQGLGGRSKTTKLLNFNRIITKNGKPGAGVAKVSRIITKPS